MSRTVNIVNQEEKLELMDESVASCVAILDQVPEFQVPEGSLDIAFIEPATCCQLHQSFFGDPDVTDVMTFPGELSDEHAGDIAICPSVALTASKEAGTDFREELTLYLVHAWLHLAGLTDNDAAGSGRMRQAERQLMDLLEKQNGLLDCGWMDEGN